MISDVGLQLSFLSTLGLIVAAPRINNPEFLKKNTPVVGPVLKYAASTVVMTLSATLFTLPLLVWYFNRISLTAPITNLLTLWSIPFIFIGGIICLLVSYIFLPAATVAAGAVSLLVKYNLFVVYRLAGFKYSAVSADSVKIILYAAALYLILFLVVFLGKTAGKILAYIFAASFCTAIFLLPAAHLKRDEVRMTLLDTGNGETMLVMTRSFTLMIDCGGTIYKNAGDIASEYLLLHGKDTVDSLLVTGFDDQYINGFNNLSKLIAVKSMTMLNTESENTEKVTTYFPDASVDYISAGKILNYSAFSAQIVVPLEYINENYAAVSVIIDTIGTDVFVAGAVDSAKTLINTGELKQADVLVLNGGTKLLKEELIKAIKPKRLYLSSKYRPKLSAEKVALLEKYDMKINGTAESGTLSESLTDRRR
jgi:competence protein ComEC